MPQNIKLMLNYIGIILWVFFLILKNVNYAFALDENRKYAFGLDKKTFDRLIANETITVESNIQSIKEQKLVYEIDFVILQFKVSDVKEELKLFIEYSDAYENIMKIFESEDKADFYKNDFPYYEEGRLVEIIAALIEKGQFILIEKKTNKQVNKITVKYYSWSKGPLYGEGGRKFYLPNGFLFLHILDYIS